MISDSDVETALAYLNDDEIVAQATYNLAVAENAVERTRADLFLFYQDAGGVEARKAQAIIHPDYQNALAAEAEARRDLARIRARINSAERIIDIWRSINANARNAERVR